MPEGTLAGGQPARAVVAVAAMRRALALCILAAAAGLGLAPIVARAADPPVTVFAAASLREALQAEAPAFTQRTGFAVPFNFGGSDTLAAQLLQGAPADVFASSNVTQMQLVLASPTVPVGNYARVAFGNLTKNPAFGENFFADVPVVLVTHDAADVEAFAAPVLRLERGKIVR